MEDLENRLIRTFQVIFPDLDNKQIRHASNTSVAAWDSVAMVTLINIVEEEFGLQIDMDDAPQLTSFERLLAYMRARSNGAKA